VPNRRGCGRPPQNPEYRPSHHHVGVTQVRFDVGFVDDEVNADGPVPERCRQNLLDEHSDVDAALGRNVDQHPPFVFAKSGTTRDSDHLGEGAIDPFEIEILDHAAAAGGIRIHVERYRLTCGQCGIHACKGILHLAPIGSAGALVMRDVQMHAALGTDAQRLFDRFEQAVALVAHVRGVQTVERLHRFRELDHFLGAAPPPRPIDEPGGEAARTLFHRAFHVAAHRRELRPRSVRAAPSPSPWCGPCCARPASGC
jgi:hypothetical protein